MNNRAFVRPSKQSDYVRKKGYVNRFTGKAYQILFFTTPRFNVSNAHLAPHDGRPGLGTRSQFGHGGQSTPAERRFLRSLAMERNGPLALSVRQNPGFSLCFAPRLQPMSARFVRASQIRTSVKAYEGKPPQHAVLATDVVRKCVNIYHPKTGDLRTKKSKPFSTRCF